LDLLWCNVIDVLLVVLVVEEMLCYDLLLYLFEWMVIDDVELYLLSGVVWVLCGYKVVVLFGVVNCDLVVFDEFDWFVVDCVFNLYLVFGVGIYFCFGVLLVWLEL